MKIALLDLVKAREIVHPTKVKSVELSASGLRLMLEGAAWWIGDPRSTGSIEFWFEDISDASIDMSLYCAVGSDYWDEMLEEFTIESAVDLAWAQPACHSIYCSAPLRDQFSLFAAVHDYLAQVDAFHKVDDFLNMGGTVRKFIEITSSTSYLVAKGPDVIRDIVMKELEKQGVPFTVLTHALSPDERLFVRFGPNVFFCRSAIATFDDQTANC